MADTVVKALMLDKIKIDGKTVLIVQHNYGSPFLHSILTHSARQGRKICLVSFNQSADYYHSVGSRLGWNLNNLSSKNQAIFIGGLLSLRDTMKKKDSANPFNFVFEQSTSPLDGLLSTIKDVLVSWTGQPFSLVFDELDSLINLGISPKDVVNFFQSCHSLIPKNNSAGSFVVSIGVTATDTEMIRFSSLLSHWSDLVLTEKGLQTGRSKDLTGILSVNWNISPSSEEHFHFKCFDRGIRLFAPGTAVL